MQFFTDSPAALPDSTFNYALSIAIDSVLAGYIFVSIPEEAE